VLIGHEHSDEDFALARNVRGIDVIFGTHSHLKQPIMQVPGTTTFFISPYQYLTYISRVDLTFDRGKITAARGNLVRMDRSIRPDRAIARRVARLQRDLERDPQYRDLFTPIGLAKIPVPLPELARLTVEAIRDAAKANVALSTISSFRQAIPPGPVNLEILRAALPYDNEIVIATMTGEQLEKLLAFGESRKGTDSYPVVTAVPPLEKKKIYRVATTDYLARSAGYREFFPTLKSTGVRVRDELRRKIWTAAARRRF
jgi:5'-nucleotidase